MYRVEGYEFETKELAEAAGRELEGIKYIRAQTRLDNPEVVLSLYNKLIFREVFETPIGYQFLYELQEYLRTVPVIRNEDIPPIPVYATLQEQKQEDAEDTQNAAKAHREAKKHAKRLDQAASELAAAKRGDKKDYKKAYRNSMIFSGICVLIILGMFLITIISGNNVTILNYENAIVDKYEAWELELEEREAAVSQKEAELEHN